MFGCATGSHVCSGRACIVLQFSVFPLSSASLVKHGDAHEGPLFMANKLICLGVSSALSCSRDCSRIIPWPNRPNRANCGLRDCSRSSPFIWYSFGVAIEPLRAHHFDSKSARGGTRSLPNESEHTISHCAPRHSASSCSAARCLSIEAHEAMFGVLSLRRLDSRMHESRKSDEAFLIDFCPKERESAPKN